MMSNQFRMSADDKTVGKMVSSEMTPAEAFTSDDRTELNYSFHEAEDESILVGIWECAPCREEIDAYPVNEMMTVLSGSVTVTNGDGEPETFTTGDSFFILKGAKVIWEITETLRKHYFIAS